MRCIVKPRHCALLPDFCSQFRFTIPSQSRLLTRYAQSRAASSPLRRSLSLAARAGLGPAVQEERDTASATEVSLQERRSAAAALSRYLRDGMGFTAAQATGIHRASPLFATKLAILAKDSREAPLSTPDIHTVASRMLGEQRLNVAEAVLESLGGDVHWVERFLSMIPDGDQGIRNLLGVVDRLHNAGVARKEMWLLFDANAELWKSTPADIEASVAALEKLAVDSTRKLILCCPFLVGRTSQKFLDQIIGELHRIEVDPKLLFNVMTLVQQAKPVTEMTLLEHGVSKDKAQLCILTWLTAHNKKLAGARDWFLENGVGEQAFWKAVFQHPTFICRSRESLDSQVVTFKKFGMSHLEAVEVIVRHSEYLVWNESVLQPKLEYLVNSMGHPIQVLASEPKYLACSLESKIKPRHQLLQWLNTVAHLQRPKSLAYLFLSELVFLRTYGKHHPDAINFYKRVQAAGTVSQQAADSPSKLPADEVGVGGLSAGSGLGTRKHMDSSTKPEDAGPMQQDSGRLIPEICWEAVECNKEAQHVADAVSEVDVPTEPSLKDVAEFQAASESRENCHAVTESTVTPSECEADDGNLWPNGDETAETDVGATGNQSVASALDDTIPSPALQSDLKMPGAAFGEVDGDQLVTADAGESKASRPDQIEERDLSEARDTNSVVKVAAGVDIGARRAEPEALTTEALGDGTIGTTVDGESAGADETGQADRIGIHQVALTGTPEPMVLEASAVESVEAGAAAQEASCEAAPALMKDTVNGNGDVGALAKPSERRVGFFSFLRGLFS